MYTSTTQPRNAGPEPTPRLSGSPSFGLRVRVALDTTQQYLFGGDGPSLVTRLAEELCIQMARIVVCDFRIHSRLNRTVPAVLRNVRLSFWSCARRAALGPPIVPPSPPGEQACTPSPEDRCVKIRIQCAKNGTNEWPTYRFGYTKAIWVEAYKRCLKPWGCAP